MSDSLDDDQVEALRTRRELASEPPKFGVELAYHQDRGHLGPRERFTIRRHLRQAECPHRGRQAMGIVVEAYPSLRGDDRFRKPALSVEHRLSLPGADEGLEPLRFEMARPSFV